MLGTIRHAAPPPLPVPLPDTLWRGLRLPASKALWLGGVGLMDPALRHRLGARWTRADELQFRVLGALNRKLDPALPESLKVMGPAHLRWRRREIARGPLGDQAAPPTAAAA